MTIGRRELMIASLGVGAAVAASREATARGSELPQPFSTYMKRMYTDTVSPHAMGMKFAIDYFGIDNVMYGTDYPCWSPAEALKYLELLELSPEDGHKLFYDNARRILGLRSASAPVVSGRVA